MDIYLATSDCIRTNGHARRSFPVGVKPEMTPITSIMGQIMMIGMWSKDGSTSPMEIGTLADWVVRQRLLTISGVAQVINMGGIANNIKSSSTRSHCYREA